jgi:hypothetical protein
MCRPLSRVAGGRTAGLVIPSPSLAPTEVSYFSPIPTVYGGGRGERCNGEPRRDAHLTLTGDDAGHGQMSSRLGTLEK